MGCLGCSDREKRGVELQQIEIDHSSLETDGTDRPVEYGAKIYLFM